MILTGKDIRGLGIIEPHCDRTVFEGMSFGESVAGYDIRIAESVMMFPNNENTTFQLVSSIEQFRMPPNILGLVKDKSSWARQGLSVFNTVIEPGWYGYLTLELALLGHKALSIPKGMPIAQVLFFQTNGRTAGYKGKYQGQRQGAQDVIYESPCKPGEWPVG